MSRDSNLRNLFQVEQLEDRRMLSVAAPTQQSTTSGSKGSVTTAATTVAPVLAAISNATANVGAVFTCQASATGTPAPVYSIRSAPLGVSINQTTGLISWKPTSSQLGARTITVTATNSAGSSSKSFTVTVVNWVAPTITTPTPPPATAGSVFTYQIAATGTPAPGFALTAAPAGMTISNTGLITWTVPATLGAQNVTVAASNVAGTVSTTFAVTVVPDTTPPTTPYLSVGTITTVDSIPLSWTASTDNVGVAGYRIYGYTPAVYKGHSGRGGGYTLVSPAKYTLLVDGITSTNYTITGLATNSSHQYAVAAYDAAGNQSGYSTVVTATTLNPPSFDWTYYGAIDPAMTDVANHALTFYFDTTGSPYPTLSVVSAPAGVVFTPGQITNSQLTMVIPNISWTPTPDEVGQNYITMQAVNSVGTYTMTIPINVTPDTPQISVSINGGITYTSGQFASGQSNYVVTANPGFGNFGYPNPQVPQYALSGTPFNFQVTSASNSGRTTFALVSGPVGMSVDPNTGAGSWTPTKDDAGNTSVLITATNTAGTSTLHLNFPTYFTGAPGTPVANYQTSTSSSLTSNPTMTWTAPADTTGVADYVLTVTDAHSNAVTTIDTHSTATSYALSGLGNQQYFVSVTPYDANGNAGIVSTSMSIYGAAMTPVSWTTSTPTAIVGAPMTVQFAPANTGYSYSIVSGPAGATINAATGLLSWTPTAAGNTPIVVAATNPNGWGNVDATLNIPVYVSDAPTGLAVTSATDPDTGATTVTASWGTPTLNVAGIAGYQLQILAPSVSSAPIVVYVPATSPLSVVLSDLGVTTGTIQVTAMDPAGNLGLASNLVLF